MKRVIRNTSIFLFLLILNFCSESILFAQSYDSTKIIRPDNDSLKSEFYFRTDEVLLNSSPQDVYVFYKDSLIGNTPMFVEGKFERLTLQKSGYDKLNISSSDITPIKTFTLKFNEQIREESFFERDIFKVLTAGIVVFGGATAYFKIKADNKFEEFEFSGNGKLLDETRKYDLISGITFTALQINFGLLLYYFLIE